MSILRLLQIGLPVSGMVGYPTEFSAVRMQPKNVTAKQTFLAD